MNLSYWEYKTWLSNIDFTIIGSGIVGLNCALELSNKYPKAKILVLEKGMLPQGASTKNAGFACFGSLSEILSDFKTHSPEDIKELVQKRYSGIQFLRQTLGDAQIGFKQFGGHELFLNKHTRAYENCLSKLTEVNDLLFPVFNKDVFKTNTNYFSFTNIKETYITQTLEGQIDTGSMMDALLIKVQRQGVKVLNNVCVLDYVENNSDVEVNTNQFSFTTKNLFIATNGFASDLTSENVKPARAQVLITEPISNLHIQGTFHLDEGYYYFRNIDNRILIGGGRNIDFRGEETMVLETTSQIQDSLVQLLKKVVLPKTTFKIAYRWSGIMGVGDLKKPIIKSLSSHVFCGVRLGGMGIAIGSYVGKELASCLKNSI